MDFYEGTKDINMHGLMRLNLMTLSKEIFLSLKYAQSLNERRGIFYLKPFTAS